MTDSALIIENLVKQYRSGTVAVDGISLEIKKGDFFGLLGPNGAGKTSIIHCVTGIAKITSGVVKVFDIDVVAEYREARKKVGLAPQEFNVDFFGEVQKVLDYVAGYYGVPKELRRKRVKELLLQFELEEHKEKAFRELSGGLKRRVMLARALVHDPELVIFDEPTAGVDVELRHDLWRYLRELNERGKTIILTSHYLEEVEMLAKNICIVNRGKIVAGGTKEEFVRDGRKLEDVYLSITKGEAW